MKSLRTVLIRHLGAAQAKIRIPANSEVYGELFMRVGTVGTE